MNRETFESRIDRAGACWTWHGVVHRDGYGRYNGVGAHRVAYELWVGPIPAAMEIDHLCRNIRCVRPDHLEPVTRDENMRRRSEAQTHCKNGHPFNAENTAARTAKARGRRRCRPCNASDAARYRARRAA